MNNDVDVTAFRGVLSGERPIYGRDETVRRLEASKNEREWNAICDEVKRAHEGYPEWWYDAVLVSGLADRMSAKFGRRPGIQVSIL